MLEKSIPTVLDPSILERPQEARNKSHCSVLTGLDLGGPRSVRCSLWERAWVGLPRCRSCSHHVLRRLSKFLDDADCLRLSNGDKDRALCQGRGENSMTRNTNCFGAWLVLRAQ